MMNIFDQQGYIPESVFSHLQKKISDKIVVDSVLAVISDLIRYNTLVSVARAGTGHLGASLSMIELLTEIYFRSFHFDPIEAGKKHRDIFILSKGHGAPSLYATLAAKGYFPIAALDKLRRLKGLQGHCDIVTPGIEANTGSLAMGLSKAVGYALGKKRFALKGSVIVIAGDAELQEGQCWEALLSAASNCLENLFVIIDDNEVQTDQYSKRIVTYGNLRKSFEFMGFDVQETDGKSIHEIHSSIVKLKKSTDKPKLIWAHTIKGQGVSFMEHPNVLKDDSDRYVWHNKVPNARELSGALDETLKRINALFKSENRNPNFETNEENSKRRNIIYKSHFSLQNIPVEPMTKGVTGKSLIEGFSKGLVEIGETDKRIVVLDGDLEEDCGFIPFHNKFPQRFFEMGIMEQHMVGTATALSRLGYIPVVGSYAAFLTSRANEQLYNLATEGGKAVIVGNMSGVIPATPGKSHQAFRDISCMKNIPGISMYQPITSQDAANALKRYSQGDFGELLYLRLSLAPASVELETPPINLPFGQPHIHRKGSDVLVIGIGPVILGECLHAAGILAEKSVSVEVWNYPWLVDFEKSVLVQLSKRNIPVLIVEDHYRKGGAGESFFAALQKSRVLINKTNHMALDGFPETGFRDEALRFVKLDCKSIAFEVLHQLL